LCRRWSALDRPFLAFMVEVLTIVLAVGTTPHLQVRCGAVRRGTRRRPGRRASAIGPD
jgi:hypothetical protein